MYTSWWEPFLDGENCIRPDWEASAYMELILGYVEIIPVLCTDATPRGHMRV
jgi:hypothetical protein